MNQKDKGRFRITNNKPVLLEPEKTGWRISKGFDHAYNRVHGYVPWHETLRMTLAGMLIIAFVVAIPVALIALFVADLR